MGFIPLLNQKVFAQNKPAAKKTAPIKSEPAVVAQKPDEFAHLPILDRALKHSEKNLLELRAVRASLRDPT